MASTPPHCSITNTKAYQSQHFGQNPNIKKHAQPWPATQKVVSLTKPSSQAPPTRPEAALRSICPLPSQPSDLASVFSGRRSTRFVSKMHHGRPKTSPASSRHSSAAEEALHISLQFAAKDHLGFDNFLSGFEGRLTGGADDYTFLLRELGNRGEVAKALKCFDFAVSREKRRNELGKLTSSMISTLGRLGKVEAARRVFDTAVERGYGTTVYSYSALISAYGRSGLWEQARGVLGSMKGAGLRPNLVTYNAVIDACGKGGAEFRHVIEVFEEMAANEVKPDRITYNSLLAVCARAGLWEAATSLFQEMAGREIDRDIYTYNTLLDALCKGGRVDMGRRIVAEMPGKGVIPNVITYSTMIDGYAKAGKLQDALGMFGEMKLLAIPLDRVLYNTLLSIYANLGSFDDASHVCREMEASGIRRDVVSFNALLAGYGKLGRYGEVERVYWQMREERVTPNLLTYSTLIDAYSKGGLYQEAMEVFREFKRAGLKADVVLYSELINALCKAGMVESAVSLLDEMTKEGVMPNVVTYNSIIDAFGRPSPAKEESSSSSSMVKMFGRFAVDKEGKKFEGRREMMCILGVFQKMHELNIKPNVVTFSAILNACSRCNSFEEASMLLEELRVVDEQVYGVAHGLLMGNKEKVWVEAQSLFEQVKNMDNSTASAFYNALSDMLWHFGQKRGAQMVVLEGKRRNVWESVWTNGSVDLHLMSSGGARAMLHSWLLNIRCVVFQGQQLPSLLSILTGWGKHSKVVGDSALRRAVESLLQHMGAPFQAAKSNLGRFTSPGPILTAWLKHSATLDLLLLQDHRPPSSSSSSSTTTHSLHPLPL